MEEFFKAVTLNLARLVEAAATIVIAVSSSRALWAYLVAVFTDRSMKVPKEEIRLSLGRSLALALELELGADILKTAVAPTWN